MPSTFAQVALDDVLTERVDFIKIDVEGYEGQVLEGARKSLERWKPNLFLEIHPAMLAGSHTLESILDLLSRYYDDIRFYQGLPQGDVLGAQGHGEVLRGRGGRHAALPRGDRGARGSWAAGHLLGGVPLPATRPRGGLPVTAAREEHGFPDRVTPVILTFNEERNIGRTLARLGWAREIVLVDSLSTDATLSIAAGHPNVRTFERRFDSHGDQWTFALRTRHPHGMGARTRCRLRIDRSPPG